MAVNSLARRDVACTHPQARLVVIAQEQQLAEVVQTNLLGSLLATRAACRVMEAQPTGGHVFNMDGAGADGAATPQYVAYGATKAGAPL